MKPVTIFLADLNHVRVGKEWTIIPFPLNVGYIAAYLAKMLPATTTIRLFKNPLTFLEALAATPPDIVAFSNYIWNKNLSLACAQYVKQSNPACITIMGGPNYNFSERDWIDHFVRAHPYVDFQVEGEGEVKMLNLVQCCLAHDLNAQAVKRANPAGVTYLDHESHLHVNTFSTPMAWSSVGHLQIDPRNGRLMNLNDIPSPYLTGILDEFLADPTYCPIIETNRGCPYACTFCNWGDMGKSQSAMFSRDRIEEELIFIAQRNRSTTPYLYIGDANFGLFPRDVEIAALLRDLKDTYAFPQSIYLYFAKNSTEKVLKIAEILKDMTPISLSRQTQNPDVLANIKRTNISIETFQKLAGLAKSLHIESFVELIYGLPGESKESFYRGVQDIMRGDVDGLHMFPAMLLNGSEMGTHASRTTYGLNGEFRKIDGCAGAYGPIKAVEYEEIVTSTNCLSRADYFEIRLFHLLQAIFLDTKLYKDVEVLLTDWTLFDLIQDLIAHQATAPPLVRQWLAQFDEQARAEFVTEPPTVFSSQDIAQSLRVVKLNPLYTAKLLYDPGVREAFHVFLADRIAAHSTVPHRHIEVILDYINSLVYPFDGTQTKRASVAVDVAALRRRTKHNGSVPRYVLNEPQVYEFSKEQTYAMLIDQAYAALPLSERVYEVILHHAHEKLRATVRWQVHDTVEVGNRTIELEGGWLF